LRGFYDWIGVSNEYILRGKNAGMFRETEKFSPDERAKFEDWIKTTYYNDFVPKVAQGRSKEAAYIDSVGQGRVWTGSQGLEKGWSMSLADWIALSKSPKTWPKSRRTKACIA